MYGYHLSQPQSTEKKAEQFAPRPNLMLDPDYRKKKMAALKVCTLSNPYI